MEEKKRGKSTWAFNIAFVTLEIRTHCIEYVGLVGQTFCFYGYSSFIDGGAVAHNQHGSEVSLFFIPCIWSIYSIQATLIFFPHHSLFCFYSRNFNFVFPAFQKFWLALKEKNIYKKKLISYLMRRDQWASVAVVAFFLLLLNMKKSAKIIWICCVSTRFSFPLSVSRRSLYLYLVHELRLVFVWVRWRTRSHFLWLVLGNFPWEILISVFLIRSISHSLCVCSVCSRFSLSFRLT